MAAKTTRRRGRNLKFGTKCFYKMGNILTYCPIDSRELLSLWFASFQIFQKILNTICRCHILIHENLQKLGGIQYFSCYFEHKFVRTDGVSRIDIRVHHPINVISSENQKNKIENMSTFRNREI